MSSWMGSNGRDGVLDLIRQRLDDQTLEDPTPKILRRFLEQKLGLEELELDDDEIKQQIKEMINEVLQEEDEPEIPAKKSRSKAPASKAKAREPKEVKTSMPKSSPLYTNLRKLCQTASLNPNKLVNSSMYLPEKVSALKKALVDAGFKLEQLKSDSISETIEVAEASKFAKENVEESSAPRGRRRAAAAVDYKAIFAKESAGIEGVDSEAESEQEVADEEENSEEDEGFSVNESVEEDASEASASEEESEAEEKPRKRSARPKARATGSGRRRGRPKKESSEDEEEEEEDEESGQDENDDDDQVEEDEQEMSEEPSEESAPKKKKQKKN